MKLFFLIITVLLNITAFAQAGQLDSTFSKDGMQITNDSGIAKASAIAVQPDGKIIVAGNLVTKADTKAMLVRYNKNGTLDNNFGDSGIDTFFIGKGTSGFLSCMVIQPDGKIIVAGTGYTFSSSDFGLFIYRFNIDGSLDSSFNKNGLVTSTMIGGTTAIGLQPDGKIVVNGELKTDKLLYDIVVARYNVNGSSDTTFNHTGMSIAPSIYETFAYGIKVQNDGKIVVCGIYNSNPVQGDIPDWTGALARYKTDGTMDSLFGMNGFFYYTEKSIGDHIYYISIDQQSDGKLVSCGTVLSRFNQNGSFDSTFGINGSVASSSLAIALQSDDKIIIGGGFKQLNNMYNFVVKRFNVNGSIDSSFGINKNGETTNTFGIHPAIAAAVCLSKNRIYLAGTSDSGFAVAAYTEDNTILPLFYLDFDATQQKTSMLLNWQTSNEINNNYFSIERSADSKLFSSIGNVKALNGTNTNNYSFTDNAPLKGVNYYRLKQFDRDGKYSYSNIVSVDFTNNVSIISVSPNPANGIVNVTTPASNAVSEIIIYDVSGKKLVSEQIPAGITFKQIDISKLTSGIYSVVLIQNGRRETLKLVKK